MFEETTSFFLSVYGVTSIFPSFTSMLTLMRSKFFFTVPSGPFTVSTLPETEAVTPSGSGWEWTISWSVDIA